MVDREDYAKFYELLGVENSSPKHHIQLVFIIKALQCHPNKVNEKGVEAKDETRRFQRLCNAYNKVSGDPEAASSCDKIFFGCITGFLTLLDNNDHSRLFVDFALTVAKADLEGLFSALDGVVSNRKSLKKYVPGYLTPEKMALLDKVSSALLSAEEQESKKGSEGQLSRKSAKTVTVPVAKPKPKTKKQILAEQHRREKEMREIAARLEEKAKLEEEKAEQRKKAEAEKQKRRDKELAQEAAEKRKKETEAKEKQQEEARKRREKERELQEKKDAEVERKRVEAKPSPHVGGGGGQQQKASKPPHPTFSADQRKEPVKRKKKAPKPLIIESGSGGDPSYKQSTKHVIPRHQQPQPSQYEVPPRFRQKLQHQPQPQQAGQSSTEEDKQKPSGKTKQKQPSRLTKSKGKDPSQLQEEEDFSRQTDNSKGGRRALEDDFQTVSNHVTSKGSSNVSSIPTEPKSQDHVVISDTSSLLNCSKWTLQSSSESSVAAAASGLLPPSSSLPSINGNTSWLSPEGDEGKREESCDVQMAYTESAVAWGGHEVGADGEDQGPAWSQAKSKRKAARGKGEGTDGEEWVEKMLPLMTEMGFDVATASKALKLNIDSFEDALSYLLAVNAVGESSPQQLSRSRTSFRPSENVGVSEEKQPPRLKPVPSSQGHLKEVRASSKVKVAREEMAAEVGGGQQRSRGKFSGEKPSTDQSSASQPTQGASLTEEKDVKTEVPAPPVQPEVPQMDPSLFQQLLFLRQLNAMNPLAGQLLALQFQQQIQLLARQQQESKAEKDGTGKGSVQLVPGAHLQQQQQLNYLMNAMRGLPPGGAPPPPFLPPLPPGPLSNSALAMALKQMQDQSQGQPSGDRGSGKDQKFPPPMLASLSTEGTNAIGGSENKVSPVGTRLSSSSADWPEQITPNSLITKTVDALKGKNPWGQDDLPFPSFFSDTGIFPAGGGLEMPSGSSPLFDKNWLSADLLTSPEAGKTNPDVLLTDKLVAHIGPPAFEPGKLWPGLKPPEAMDDDESVLGGSLERAAPTAAGRMDGQMPLERSTSGPFGKEANPPAFQANATNTSSATQSLPVFLAGQTNDGIFGGLNSEGSPPWASRSAPQSAISSPIAVGKDGSMWNGGAAIPKKATSAWILLRNLAQQASSDEVRELCQQHGCVKTFEPNLRNGTALVKYGSPTEAEQASGRLNSTNVKGSVVSARIAADEDFPLFYEQLSTASPKEQPASGQRPHPASPTSPAAVFSPTLPQTADDAVSLGLDAGKLDPFDDQKQKNKRLGSLDSVLSSLGPTLPPMGGIWQTNAPAPLSPGPWGQGSGRVARGGLFGSESS
eukprot:m.7720 g.7720  ORF g.7720 m.7720 type:complete len:1324 (+) comp19461_c0_seq1:59-4030(+)